MSGLAGNQTQYQSSPLKKTRPYWSMYIQADTSLFVSGALSIGPVANVGQDGGQLVVVVFWATH